MNRKLSLIAIVVGVVSVIALAGIITSTNHDNASAATAPQCPPADISKITAVIPVKLPADLPTGYSLQGIESQMNNTQVLAFYADHPLCVFPKGFDYHGAQLRVVITKVGQSESSATYQQNWLNYAADPKNQIVAKVQPIEINGHKGVGWDPYDTYSVVRSNGQVIERTPFRGDGALFFLNDNDHTQYSIFGSGSISLQQLEQIASSISK